MLLVIILYKGWIFVVELPLFFCANCVCCSRVRSPAGDGEWRGTQGEVGASGCTRSRPSTGRLRTSFAFSRDYSKSKRGHGVHDVGGVDVLPPGASCREGVQTNLQASGVACTLARPFSPRGEIVCCLRHMAQGEIGCAYLCLQHDSFLVKIRLI